MGKDYLQNDRNNINFLNGLRKAVGADLLTEGAAGRVYMTGEQHAAYQRTADAAQRAKRAVDAAEVQQADAIIDSAADARLDADVENRQREAE